MIKNHHQIAILMATFNGAAYLSEQLDSLLTQTEKDWMLFVHDDGSTDNTCAILNTYAEQYPDRIYLFDYPSQGGACHNFLSLLEQVDSNYYMFCDQDDVWLPEKIEHTFLAMQLQEKEHPYQPIAVATDLRVTDNLLHTLNESLWFIGGIYPQYVRTFNDLAANTQVTGCTMLFNQKAKEAIRPATPNALMHDAWTIACIHKSGGIVECLPEQTVLYRQHGGNTIGAQDVVHLSLLDRLKRINVSWTINSTLYRMLSDLQYGSILKFIYYKYLFHRRIRRGYY